MQLSYLNFRKDIIRTIFSMLRVDIPNGLRNAMNEGHTLVKTNQRNCKVCSTRNDRKQSVYSCPDPGCNVGCHPECFVRLHTTNVPYNHKIL